MSSMALCSCKHEWPLWEAESGDGHFLPASSAQESLLVQNSLM